MMSAVKNYRADSLKEAINLYETAVSQWRLEKVLNNAAQMRQIHFEYMAEAVSEIEKKQQAIYHEIQDLKYRQFDNENNYF